MTVRQHRLGHGKLILTSSQVPTAFESQVLSCVLTPKVSKKEPVEVLSGEKVGGERTETFTMKGKLFDDFGIEGSVVEWLFTNRGKTFDAEFLPSDKSKSKVLCQVIVEATDIGGDVGKVNELDFEWDALDPKLAVNTPA